MLRTALLAALLLAQAAAHAVEVRGLVRNLDTRKGVADVIVSNGESFTRTSSDGAFTLAVDPQRHRFVFYTTPTGMRPNGAFYRSVEDVVGRDDGRPVFELRAAPERAKDTFRFVHVTDSHIATDRKAAYALPEHLRTDMQRLVSNESPAFFVATGDLTDLGFREDLQAYRGVIESLSKPTFSLYAGHDGIAPTRFKLDYETTAPYRENLGPLSYAFEWGGWHFLVYPELFFEQERGDLEQVERWFWQYLEALPDDERIIVLAHDPSRFHRTEGMFEPTPSATQLKRVHAGVRLVLHGQYHTIRTVAHDGVVVSGTAPITMGGIDTSPRGYAVVTVKNEQVSVEHKWLGARDNDARERKAGALKSGWPKDMAAGAAILWSTKLPRSLHRAKPWVNDSLAVYSLGDHGAAGTRGLVALDLETGQERWRVQTDSTVKNTVTPDGKETPEVIYALSVAGRLYRVRLADGAVEWAADLPRYPDRWLFTRPVVRDDVVLVIQYSGTAALDARTGKMLWTAGEQWENGWSPVYQEPPVGERFYYQLTTKSLGDYAVSAHRIANGEIVWRQRLDVHPTGNYPALYQLSYPSPLLTSSSLIVSGLGDRLWAFQPESGLLQWTEGALRKEGPESGPKPSSYYAVREQASGFAADELRLYATTSNGWVYALDPRTGERQWEFNSTRAALVDMQPYFRDGPNVLTEPLVIGEDVLVGGTDGFIYALDRRTGKLRYERNLGVAITVPPVRTRTGVLISLLNGEIIHVEFREARDESIS